MLKTARATFLFFANLRVVVHGRTILPSHSNPSLVKHFEAILDPTEGFWSPSTSSIDWCERNYAVNFYFAEFWNCLSSLLMCVFAFALFVRAISFRLESRFLLMNISFGLVGLGSAYFHGTLTHVGQMADELPMVYSMIVWWFILFNMDEKRRSKHSVADLSLILGIAYGAFWTYIHTLKTFVLIFQIHFALMVFGGIARLIYLYRQRIYRQSTIFYLLFSYVGFILLASICWLLDQRFCESFNRTFPLNPQLHAWWHVLCAIDCHCGIVCAEAMRFLSLQSHHQFSEGENHLRLVFFFGLPFVDYAQLKTKEKKK